IGRLPHTVASRCVSVRMRRRAPSERRVERLRGSRLKAELEPLRRMLARWCLDHGEAIGAADPQVPDTLDDREADNWTTLLAIADAIGGDWPTRGRAAAASRDGVVDDEAGVLLLSDL